MNREYNAWGEFAELVSDSDWELIGLAKNYLNSDDETKEENKKRILNYIKNANIREKVEEFGKKLKIVKYSFENEEYIDSLCKRLIPNDGPGSFSGIEYQEFDAESGRITEYAEFNLE